MAPAPHHADGRDRAGNGRDPDLRYRGDRQAPDPEPGGAELPASLRGGSTGDVHRRPPQGAAHRHRSAHGERRPVLHGLFARLREPGRGLVVDRRDARRHPHRLRAGGDRLPPRRTPAHGDRPGRAARPRRPPAARVPGPQLRRWDPARHSRRPRRLRRRARCAVPPRLIPDTLLDGGRTRGRHTDCARWCPGIAAARRPHGAFRRTCARPGRLPLPGLPLHCAGRSG